jgi:uncharacterized protein
MSDISVDVQHNAAENRFVAVVDGLLCRLDYRQVGNVMRVHHTEVPPRLEGRGIASRLSGAAFEHARQNGLQVQPLCSYVRAWARRHPEHQDLIAS